MTPTLPHEFCIDHLDIIREATIPRYLHIAECIEKKILDGDIPVGHRLEGELHLARRLNVSRFTVRGAMDHLAKRGLVQRSPGIGTLVTIRPTSHNPVIGLYDALHSAGRCPTTRVLTFETGSADRDIAKTLGIRPGRPVLTLRRLRYADGEPLALLTTQLINYSNLTAPELEADGLLATLRKKGIRIGALVRQVSARISDATETRELGLAEPSPVLTEHSRLYDRHGRPLALSQHVLLGDRATLDVVTHQHVISDIT